MLENTLSVGVHFGVMTRLFMMAKGIQCLYLTVFEELNLPLVSEIFNE